MEFIILVPTGNTYVEKSPFELTTQEKVELIKQLDSGIKQEVKLIDCRKRSCSNYRGLKGSIADENCHKCSSSYLDRYYHKRG